MSPKISRPFQYLVVVLLAMACFASTMARANPETEINVTEAYALLEQNKVTLVDIRTPQEWRQTGVAKGAKRVNLLDPQGLQGFAQKIYEAVNGDLNAPIVLICRTGNRTSKVTPILRQAGFTNLKHAPQGMVGSKAGKGWIDSGLPVEPCPNC